MSQPAAAQIETHSHEQAAARGAVATSAALAALLGLFILFGVGIAQPEIMHNAAHDSRHALTFPCH